MCSVPNAFVCIEVKVIRIYLLLACFFKHTAIILNTTVDKVYSEEYETLKLIDPDL